MDDFTRLTIAYAILGVLLAIGIPLLIIRHPSPHHPAPAAQARETAATGG